MSLQDIKKECFDCGSHDTITEGNKMSCRKCGCSFLVKKNYGEYKKMLLKENN